MRHGVYTIPSGAGFLKRLAEGLLAMSRDGDEFTLSQMRVLLPTRRAGRELRDAFLTLAKDKPILLPRLQPIGDVDAEEVELYLSGYGLDGHDIPPAITGLERQFILATLIQKKDPELGLDSALALARDLARLIDTVHTEDLDFTGLTNIVPDTLAAHWQKTLSFLEIITEYWPKILEERGQIDPADRRNRLLKSLSHLWQSEPPQTPIIAAGSTGSIPSSAELLKTIAGLPQGVVILPGLDKDLDEASWNALTDTHPQATMRNLIQRMNLERQDVQLWPEANHYQSLRAPLIRSIMRPTETFGQILDPWNEDTLSNLHVVETENPREEAAVIALALREALETPDRTACLVTPDRTLARRVMTALHRWGIEVDDSAGGALATTRGATYLASILRVVEENFAPLSLLDFLKHDYQRLISPEDIAEFERHVLRGSRPAPGLEGWDRRLNYHATSEHIGVYRNMISLLREHFAPFLAIHQQDVTLDIYIEALISSAETFAGGGEFLWSRPESQALSNFITGVIEYAHIIPPLSLRLFSGVFSELVLTENYRPEDAPHRRILILGQLESRLIARDVMICAGLNEGTWPKDPGHDPWMSRPMRRNFGLPSAERSTGLAAHDFVEHLSSKHVLLTRSLKENGTATVPARWLQKLRTLLKAKDLDTNWTQSSPYIIWARTMDKSDVQRPLLSSAPAPCPPLSARPQSLSATTIEKWMRNPYRIYAERILDLPFLDAIDKDATQADRGTFVHDVLLEFVRTYSGELPTDSRSILLDIGRKKLSEMETVLPHWHYWWPRFERLIDWFLITEKNWRDEAYPWVQEENGSYLLYQNSETKRHFKVKAKADRIDRLKTGGAVVVDYKTGTPPSIYRLKNGTAPQLPIESFILSKGGYRDTPMPPIDMHFWKLSGSHSQPGMVKPMKLDMDGVLTATEQGLIDLVTYFEKPETPYIAKVLSGRLYDDERAYGHLARMAEWSSGESNTDEPVDGEGDTE